MHLTHRLACIGQGSLPALLEGLLAELESADERVFRWGLRSIDLWPQILAALPAPVEFRCDGSLLVAHREDVGAARRVLDVLAHMAAPGHAAQPISAAE